MDSNVCIYVKINISHIVFKFTSERNQWSKTLASYCECTQFLI
jgi:hypothetical protein